MGDKNECSNTYGDGISIKLLKSLNYTDRWDNFMIHKTYINKAIKENNLEAVINV